MIAEHDYQNITHFGNGRTLNVLWDAWQNSEKQPFSKRRDIFLWILEHLLKEGRIKLHKNRVLLSTPIEDQIELFRKAWPASIKTSGYEDFDWWFFDPECPVGVAWRREDGHYEIAD